MHIRQVSADQWYRIDKGDGKLLAVNGVAVFRAAHSYFNAVQEVVAFGRFATPFAIYSRGSLLTEAEKEVSE